jgi:hypothetical protein
MDDVSGDEDEEGAWARVRLSGWGLSSAAVSAGSATSRVIAAAWPKTVTSSSRAPSPAKVCGT